MAPDTIVGIDLGTTALKAAIFDTSGELLEFAETDYPIARPRREWAEQNPNDWLDALTTVLEQLSATTGVSSASAVGICSQVNTHVFVDADGIALRPAIIWQDQRCGPIATALNQQLASAAPKKAARYSLAASSLPARAAWVSINEPDIWQRTRYIVSPKDLLTHHLCRLDEPVTDPITPFDLVTDDGVYDNDVVDLVAGVDQRLPEPKPISASIGTVIDRDRPLIEGAAVVTGTMDAWGSVYGSAIVDHGDAMEVSGTSEILGLVSRERHPAAGVVSFLPVDGLHLHAGPTQAGGDAVSWFASVAGITVTDAHQLAALAPPGADGLIFMPHLLGERAPLWDSDARAAFIGLSTDHTPAHLCRAVLEGVAYSARHLLETLEQAAGVAPSELRASGGGSQSDLWCQIKADVLDIPIARLRVRHSGCLGAALLAAVGADLIPGGIRQAASNSVRVERVFHPQPTRAAYDDLYLIYRDLYSALTPTYAALAQLRHAAARPSSGEEAQ